MFPEGEVVHMSNLHQLCLAVDALLRISDYQRRRIAKHFQRYKAQAALFKLCLGPHRNAAESNSERPSMSMTSAVLAAMSARARSSKHKTPAAVDPKPPTAESPQRSTTGQ